MQQAGRSDNESLFSRPRKTGPLLLPMNEEREGRDALDDTLGSTMLTLPQLHQDAHLPQRGRRDAFVFLLETDLLEGDDLVGLSLLFARTREGRGKGEKGRGRKGEGRREGKRGKGGKEVRCGEEKTRGRGRRTCRHR